jgi:hypothetical protein
VKTILVDSSLNTGFNATLDAIARIGIEEKALGQGGFGEVYRILQIDSRQPAAPQVAKILIDNGMGIAQRGYQTIQELQQRLRTKNDDYLRVKGHSLLQEYPALAGVPQVSFTGRLNGRRVIGYSSNDLTAAGLEDFGRILDDNRKIRQFQSLPLAIRLSLAHQLVTAFEFLSVQIRFIHADIKAEALFVGLKNPGCALIDFDSGALARDLNDKPTTFGTRQDWLAPEIAAQLDAAGNTARMIKVDLFSDVWSVNIAIHYLLFGCHPLFFLTEISPRSIRAYFARYQWPDVDSRFPFFRSEYAAQYQQYAAHIRSALPASVLKRLQFTINKGYDCPADRTSYGQWRTVLNGVSRPAIHAFAADRQFVDDRRPVRLTWDIQGAAHLEIPGIGDVSDRTSIDVAVTRDTTFTLILTPLQGAPISRSVQIEVSKTPPSIQGFEAGKTVVTDKTPVRLTWTVSGANSIEIDGVGDVTGRQFVDIPVRKDSIFRLRATTLFGVSATATVQVTVSRTPPHIVFRADRTLLTDSRPVTLSWEVSEDAEAVFLEGVGPVPRTGQTQLAQTRDTEYQLRAVSLFGRSSEQRLVVAVTKDAPVIETFVATPLFIRQGMETTISWRVVGAANVRIEPGIGRVALEGSRVVRMGSDANFVLTAESYFGVQATQKLAVRLLRSSTLAALTAPVYPTATNLLDQRSKLQRSTAD